MSRKLSSNTWKFLVIFASLVHAFYAGYGFWSLNSTNNLFINSLIVLGVLWFVGVTFIGMADFWHLFETEEDEKSEVFKFEAYVNKAKGVDL